MYFFTLLIILSEYYFYACIWIHSSDIRIVSVDENEFDTDPPSPENAIGQCTALYEYVAQQPDELSIQAGTYTSTSLKQSHEQQTPASPCARRSSLTTLRIRIEATVDIMHVLLTVFHIVKLYERHD